MKVHCDALRDAQEEAPAAHGDCGHEIYSGEFLAEWEGKMLCPDCWKKAVMAELREAPLQIALEMQLNVERYL